ncbi:large ribosomal subunit protein eL28-like [Rattus norvegicus]|uniref:large ribosomal subunit protein eL28-like n=1 Tax=Rattus norvegicus TaxID=10116 RepID=UPI002FD7F844
MAVGEGELGHRFGGFENKVLFFPSPAAIERGAAAMSAHLQWMVVRNCSSVLIKRNEQTTYTMEPNNLRARNAFSYSGLIHHKTVGAEPVADGRRGRGGYETQIRSAKPATSYVRTTIKKECVGYSGIRHVIWHQTRDPASGT